MRGEENRRRSQRWEEYCERGRKKSQLASLDRFFMPSGEEALLS